MIRTVDLVMAVAEAPHVLPPPPLCSGADASSSCCDPATPEWRGAFADASAKSRRRRHSGDGVDERRSRPRGRSRRRGGDRRPLHANGRLCAVNKLWKALPDLALIHDVAFKGMDAADIAAAVRVLQTATERLETSIERS